MNLGPGQLFFLCDGSFWRRGKQVSKRGEFSKSSLPFLFGNLQSATTVVDEDNSELNCAVEDMLTGSAMLVEE